MLPSFKLDVVESEPTPRLANHACFLRISQRAVPNTLACLDTAHAQPTSIYIYIHTYIDTHTSLACMGLICSVQCSKQLRVVRFR